MKKAKEFDLAKARRVTPQETKAFKGAIERTLEVKRPARGRPPKGPAKYKDVHIRLHPAALAWAHAEARHRGIGYQTFINEVLLHGAHIAVHK